MQIRLIILAFSIIIMDILYYYYTILVYITYIIPLKLIEYQDYLPLIFVLLFLGSNVFMPINYLLGFYYGG